MTKPEVTYSELIKEFSELPEGWIDEYTYLPRPRSCDLVDAYEQNDAQVEVIEIPGKIIVLCLFPN